MVMRGGRIERTEKERERHEVVGRERAFVCRARQGHQRPPVTSADRRSGYRPTALTRQLGPITYRFWVGIAARKPHLGWSSFKNGHRWLAEGN